MSLFTSPQVINDGTADRSFVFRSQIADKKKATTVASEWVEPAATLAERSSIFIKHDGSSKTQVRRLFQKVGYLPIADGTLKSATINLTITHHPEHAESALIKAALIVLNGLKVTNALANFLRGHI